MEPRKQPVSPEIALASEVFDQFCAASTLKTILGYHRHLCELLRIKPSPFPLFYPKLKGKLRSWKAQALWTKFDKRASHKCYNRGKACPNTRVLIIGCGPCGLRTAIEAQLLGAKVVVVEKRDRFSRNNVLHLWPFVIHDLRALGAKKFFGKFCAGAIDHISIRALQCILLKVALILGVEIHEGVGFEGLVPPPADQTIDKVGWRAETSPPDHPVSQYEFDVLIGADGKRNTLEGFKRKEFRGKLAIAITANFINRHSEAEARVEEISGVAFIFNQKFFKDLYQETGIDLENIVYYKDETHYFVMTAKKHSLIDKGVILQDYADTAKLLAPENVDKDALQAYAREAADFSTGYKLPLLEFAVNHYGQPDVAMFDFTSMFAAENASRVIERHGYRLLQILVGDSLLEPFWPTGSGCARGFLSSMDACWAIKGWGGGQMTTLEVLAERESVYRILGQTTPENLQRDYNSYTLDPHSRYPNLNSRCVLAFQVRGLYDTDDPTGVEQALPATGTGLSPHDAPKKRRRKVKDSQVHPDTLLMWLKKQVALYDNVHVENMTESFKNGLVLCAIIHRYRPDLIDFQSLRPDDVTRNNQLAFDTLERELGIPPVMTGLEMEQCDVPDKLSMLSYLSQVYDAFRGEIPQLKYPKLELEKKEEPPAAPVSRAARHRQLNPDQKVNLLGRLVSTSGGGGPQHHHHSHRKRPSGDRDTAGRSVSPGMVGRRRPNKRRSVERGTDDFKPKELEGKPGEKDGNFSNLIQTIEIKLQGSKPSEKKPRDLNRAIGKIEKSDWNVKELEKKIQENKMGPSTGGKKDRESVPKWNRQQFDDKFRAVESRLHHRGGEQLADKFLEIDRSLKNLGKKLKEGSSLDAGPRGNNKVSAMAEQFAVKTTEPEAPPLVKSNSRAALVLPAQGGSENCHFCGKRVYLMERLSAVGKFFHRGCFRCEYCGTALRLNNYAFDRDGKYGSRFFCNQHFGMQGKQRAARKGEENRSGRDKENIPAKKTPTKTPEKAKAAGGTPDKLDAPRNTPERIEFENLEDEAPGEMDEDEWTDRNFGASAAEVSSDSLSDMSSDSSEEEEQNEVFEEAMEQPLTADETRRLAEDWSRRYSKSNGETRGHGDSDDYSNEEYESDDDESDTATEGEGEADKQARELRRQELCLEVPPRPRRDSDTATGSDTEVASDSGSDSESEEKENSATEIETDSEFEHDGTTPTRHHEVPSILVEPPRRVQVRSGHINGTARGVRLEFSPLQAAAKTNNKPPATAAVTPAPAPAPTPLVNPRRGDYLLNRTHSTEGIASKMSLELKKKYLLGASVLGGSVRKSGSASTLDSKMKSFVDVISEHQKLLNPAPEPSATMQAFLQGTCNLRASTGTLSPPSPTLKLPPSPSQQLLRRKELPPVGDDFGHICGKKEEEKTTNGEMPNTTTMQPVLEVSESSSKAEEPPHEEEADCRPRSPAHETSIVVPDIPWISSQKKDEEEDIESDSLSSSEGSSSDLDDDSEEHGTRSPSPVHERTPPRVEIHNSSGQLMDEAGGVVVEPEGDAVENVEAEVKEEKPEVIDISSPEPAQPEVVDISESPLAETKPCIKQESPKSTPEVVDLCSPGEMVVEVCSPDEPMVQEVEVATTQDKRGSLSEAREKMEPLNLDKRASLTSDRSSPSSTRGDESESLHNEATLAETELSDWAQDGVVSEDLEDVEFNIDPEFVTVRKHRKTRTNRNTSRGAGPTAFARIARGEDFGEFDDDGGELPGHVCGKDKPPAPTGLHSEIDNIEFMDSGDEDEDNSSTDDLLDATNRVLLKNSGYVQFVDAEDDALTPVAAPPDIPTFVVSECECEEPVEAVNRELVEDEESSLQPEGTTTEETTTTSEAATVKDNDNTEVFYTPKQEPAEITPEVKDGDAQAYEDYVRHLQGRISPFSNVRDSIDIRKSRRKNNKVLPTDDQQKPEQIAEEITEDSSMSPKQSMNNTLGLNSPSTSRKLEEISRERSKQKDLIHDMVLARLSSQKKQRRSSRTTPAVSPGKGDLEIPLENGGTSMVLATENKGIEVPVINSRTSATVKTSVEVPAVSESHEVPLISSRIPSAAKMSAEVSLPSSRASDAEAPYRSGSSTTTLEMPSVALPVADKSGSVHEDLEVPFADDTALVTEETEQFFTPLTSFKQKPKTKPQRPLSFRAHALPETPLTNPEAFSLPDIRKALFRTPDEPVAPPRHRTRPKSGDERPRFERATSDPSEPVRPVSPPSKATFYVGREVASEGASPKDHKKQKDPERRKSIIQAVSDFFHKKSPSPPKTPTSRERFKFKFTKSKDKGKSAYSSCSDDSDDKVDAGRSKSETRPPPVPPLPSNYPLSGSSRHLPRASEDRDRDSFSEAEEDSRATAVSTPTQESGGSLNRRQSRMHRRVARQAQLKRLRMAQEIQRQLEEVEVKQRELERRGVSVEKALRGEGEGVEVSPGSGQEDEAELLREWFELVRERSELRRYEHELLVRAEELELEDRHARLQQELRDRLASDDAAKTSDDVAKEGQILEEMLEIVERRDSLIALLEEDRQRYQEEDRDFEAQMLAKGLRLTPLRKESHV